jgi:hypothetical protein
MMNRMLGLLSLGLACTFVRAGLVLPTAPLSGRKSNVLSLLWARWIVRLTFLPLYSTVTL